MTLATCAACGEPIAHLPPGQEEPCALPDDWPDTQQTSVFVGDHERRLHWVCYEAEQTLAQARMF